MTSSNQKERFQTKIAMLEQNNQVLQNKCEEYLGELIRTRKALDLALNCLNGVTKDLPWVKRTLEQITALEQKD